ncbi:leucine-rich repeat-containing protein 74B-like [Hetaerina americana]|uniref:leucine-rich repeat-containing protein 74B-like n=1 Tax=Hetaerina americana TaxID=62018 RepID=UPI003A7F56D4
MDQDEGISGEIPEETDINVRLQSDAEEVKTEERSLSHQSSFLNIISAESEDANSSVDVINNDGNFLSNDSIFPVIHDPGLDAIFSKYEALKQNSVEGGEEKYLRLCKNIGVPPVESFYKSLSKDEIDLSFYGVNPRGIRAMTEALFFNPYVINLNLEDNHLTCDAVFHIGEMLYVNGALGELNLKGCRIGHRGAEALALGLLSNTSLLTLNLADNIITDKGLKFLILPLTEHVMLRKIILSNNGLTERSAIRLSKPIEENGMLRELDLSWNYLNSADGCKKLFVGIMKSTSLEALTISWNGLDELAARHIALCLDRSVTLERLDVSNNSLDDNCVATISKGLQKNGYLKSLNIGMNPFTQDGARSLLEKLLKPTPVLEVLDLGNIMFTKDFKQLFSQILKVRILKVTFGGYNSLFEIKGPNVKELLLKRAKYVAQKPKKNKKDFGQFVLKLGEKPVHKDEFETSIKQAKIKLDNDLIQEMMKAFKIKQRVDIQEIKNQYMRVFPDTILAEKKKNKGKKKTKGKSKMKKK